MKDLFTIFENENDLNHLIQILLEDFIVIETIIKSKVTKYIVVMVNNQIEIIIFKNFDIFVNYLGSNNDREYMIQKIINRKLKAMLFLINKGYKIEIEN